MAFISSVFIFSLKCQKRHMSIFWSKRSIATPFSPVCSLVLQNGKLSCLNSSLQIVCATQNVCNDKPSTCFNRLVFSRYKRFKSIQGAFKHQMDVLQCTTASFTSLDTHKITHNVLAHLVISWKTKKITIAELQTTKHLSHLIVKQLWTMEEKIPVYFKGQFLVRFC